MKKIKDVAVIGCGRFGYQVAMTLTQVGVDVIAIDEQEEIIINYQTMSHTPFAPTSHRKMFLQRSGSVTAMQPLSVSATAQRRLSWRRSHVRSSAFR